MIRINLPRPPQRQTEGKRKMVIGAVGTVVFFALLGLSVIGIFGVAKAGRESGSKTSVQIPQLPDSYFAEAARKALAEQAGKVKEAANDTSFIYCLWQNDKMLEMAAFTGSIERKGDPPFLYWQDSNGVSHSHLAAVCHVSTGPLVLPGIIRSDRPPTEALSR